MIAALLALQILTLVALVLLWARKQETAKDDPRLAALPEQVSQLAGRLGALSEDVRGQIAQLRAESGEASRALREEVQGSIRVLGTTLNEGLTSFRGDNKGEAEALRKAVDSQLQKLAGDFAKFAGDTAQRQLGDREALHNALTQMRRENTEQGDKLRGSVQESLSTLSKANEGKLEEMRLTVDEKLQKTLHSRLTESFGAVTDQLTKVHAGLGEMNSLTVGVNDLNRVFSNVKSRGGFAEVQLGTLLEQVLAPGQFVRNARVKENSLEVVEFAVKFPSDDGDVLLPIDAKFPREDWERLETAYEKGTAEEVDVARRAFDAAIRTEGKRICSKYIHEPVTTPYAIMFLPTEGLYAEVLRRDGLQADLHQNCRVMVAGPSNLYALLTSFQLGFRMLNLQKKGDEVWKVLAKTQTEFKTFETLMSSMEKQVGTVQNTIQKLGVRTRAINRTLRDVSEVGTEAALPAGFDGLLPMLAAAEDAEAEE